jgi:DNA-binding PadR family transcriptional regulator
LAAGQTLKDGGRSSFYGYDLASYLEDADGAYRRTGFSNLYRTLDRLESRKLLSSMWDVNGPRPRRVYQLTALGEKVLVEPSQVTAKPHFNLRPAVS